MLRVAQAREKIAARVRRLDVETVPLDDALGRILADDARARRSLPPRDNSAMDGYAVIAGDVPGSLPIAAEVAAGASQLPAHQPQTATRIMTGAPVPDGADTVVIRENVVVEGETAIFEQPARAGANIRKAGEDIAAGDVALAGGTTIEAGEIGLLAALGFPSLTVSRRPVVSILSTGNELIPVTENPPADRIINSNAHALAAQVRLAGGEPRICPIVRDNKAEVIAAIARALEGVDVLVTSGGVSVGDYDFVKEALEANGITPDFWKVAVKPGKPLVFGAAPSGALVFGLPGNPVSSMISFELFVRPALRAMMGSASADRRRVWASLTQDYRKDAGRTHFLRATLQATESGYVADPFRRQGSGMLTSMTGADALVVIDEQVTSVASGDNVEAIVLREA